MNIIMAVIGLVGLKRAPECIKMHHFEGENAKIFLGSPQTPPPLGRGIPPPQIPPPSTPSAPPFECLRTRPPRPHFLDTGLEGRDPPGKILATGLYILNENDDDEDFPPPGQRLANIL